jgi:hypothetical protein
MLTDNSEVRAASIIRAMIGARDAGCGLELGDGRRNGEAVDRGSETRGMMGMLMIGARRRAA